MTPLLRLRCLLLVACLLLPAPAFAAWPTDPALNLPLCTASNGQSDPHAISDGAGGTFVCWTDYRSNTLAVYLQRLDPQGTPLWTPNGIALTNGSAAAAGPRLLLDGSGGVIIVWFSGSDLHAQRVGPTGALLWGAPGVAVTAVASTKYDMDVVSDGAGGVVCGWADQRSAGSYLQYAQRLDASGHVLWSANGVPLTADNSGANGMFAPDGTGGVISTWTDTHSGNWDVYDQRLDGTGAPRWGANGITVCPQPQAKWMPAVVSDVADGAIVAWTDLRAPYPNRVYAQRLDPNGARLWPDGGVPFAPAGSSQFGDTLLADGHGGVFGVWNNHYESPQSLLAQHLDGAGIAQWPATGAVVDTSGDIPLNPMLASDGFGGLLVAWQDGQWGQYDLRAQSLSAAGARRWSDAGVPLCIAAGSQSNVTLAGDGNGGFVAAWVDLRSDPYGDIYAQHVAFDGSAGSLDVPPATVPHTLALSAPWPSPARAGETIALRYVLPADAHVRITLTDVSGRVLRMLEDGARPAGARNAAWDGRDAAGRRAAPGLYFVRLEAAGRTASAKLVLAP